jgi:hypothetical protein
MLSEDSDRQSSKSTPSEQSPSEHSGDLDFRNQPIDPSVIRHSPFIDTTDSDEVILAQSSSPEEISDISETNEPHPFFEPRQEFILPVQVPQTTIPSAASGSNAIPINKNIPRFQPPTFHQQTQTRINMEQTHQTPSSPPILTPATRNIQPPAVFTPQSESQQERQILAKKKVRSEVSIPQELPFSTREKCQSRVPELLDEDVIMADPQPVPKPHKAVVRTPKETAPPPVTVAKKPGRQSEISSKVDEKKIVSELLDVPVTLRVAELLAVAPGITNNITEILRPRNMNSKVTSPLIY